MTKPTLESLSQRLDEVERKLAAQQTNLMLPRRNWRSVVGISERTEFSERLIEEMNAIREADRAAAESES